jgi:hypothetical protein
MPDNPLPFRFCVNRLALWITWQRQRARTKRGWRPKIIINEALKLFASNELRTEFSQLNIPTNGFLKNGCQLHAMLNLVHLRNVIEKKSGAPTLQCEPAAMRRYLGFDKAAMQRDGFDPSTIEMHEQFYGRLESFMQHPLIGEYLTSLTPIESYNASGVWVCTLRQIRDATFGEGSPDSDLFPHGYIPVAGDGGGNSVSFHSPSGRVIFAHHERTSDIIAGDEQVLAEDICQFLDDLVHDRLTDELDALD